MCISSDKFSLANLIDNHGLAKEEVRSHPKSVLEELQPLSISSFISLTEKEADKNAEKNFASLRIDGGSTGQRRMGLGAI